MAEYYSEALDRLLRVIIKLDDLEDAYDFFSDVCTIKELQDMAQRLDAAVLLAKGENYQNISKQVGISTATISRVSRALNYGRGGYRKALEKCGAVKNEN